MKSIILSLNIILMLAVSIYGFVCTPNFCDTVRCQEVTRDNCKDQIVKNGGTCGCCDSCVKALGPGDSCSVLFLTGGGTPTVKCPPGYTCNRGTHTCQPY